VNSEDPQDLENQYPLNQTNTTNTGKNNVRKGRLRKNKEAIDNNKPEGGEDKEDDPSESEDGGENQGATSVPPDNIELLRNHIEMQDEELVMQRELLMVILNQNEELTNTIKVLQEHINFNPDINKVKGSNQTSINLDPKNHKGRGISNINAGPNKPRVTFNSHINPEPKHQGVTKREIQAMIAQQMHIPGGGYAIPLVRKCGHPYPSIYDLEEYPKGYVIMKFKDFSREENRDLNSEQHLTHFITSCGNTGRNDALLLR
jgi:hypothetical protein